MNTIKKVVTRYTTFTFIGLQMLFFAGDITAMRMSPEGKKSVQRYWKKYTEKTAIADKKKEPIKKEQFEQLLQTNEIAKGWFQGPSKAWKNKIILLAFELLEPYKNRAKYASNFDQLRSYIISAICNAIHDYDKLCYFHLYDPDVCKEIITKLDNLIEYSMSPTKREPTFLNTLIFPNRQFESRALYEQLLEQRKQKQYVD